MRHSTLNGSIHELVVQKLFHVLSYKIHDLNLMDPGIAVDRSAYQLPYGWEKRCSSDGQTYYINHITQKTTSTDPRLAFAVDSSTNAGDIRQKFDASSTALQVLRGCDLTGSHVVITGANCGIGFETARALALHGAHVVLACRNMRSANSAVNVIKTENVAADVEAMFVDLTSLKTVQNFACSYVSRNIPLNVLILNAGVFGSPHSLTDDGFETTFQTNHLGHFYLVQLLTDLLVQSAPARVVAVSSESHRFTDLSEKTICESLLSPVSPKHYWPIFSYNASKACNILLIDELRRRLSDSDVLCLAVHPGNVVATGITRHWWFWRLIFTLVRPFSKSKQQAAATTVYCATSSDMKSARGFYFNNCFQCTPSQEATNESTAKWLWELSEQMIARARTLSTKPTTFDV